MDLAHGMPHQRSRSSSSWLAVQDPTLQALFQPATGDIDMALLHSCKTSNTSNNDCSTDIHNCGQQNNSGSASNNSHAGIHDNPGGWSLLVQQMGEMQCLMQDMNTRMDRFQRHLTLSKQSSMNHEEEQRESIETLLEATTAPLVVSTTTTTASAIHALSHEHQRQQTSRSTTASITEESFDFTSTLTSPPNASKVDEMVETTAHMQPETMSVQHQIGTPPCFVSASSCRVHPISDESSRTTQKPFTSSSDDVHSTRSILPATHPTKGDLLTSRWAVIKDHLRVPTTTKEEVPGTPWRSSARRLSLDHGLHQEGAENCIRHVQLDRLLRDSNAISPNPSLLRRMSSTLESSVFDHPANKLHRFSVHHDSKARLIWDSIIMTMILADVLLTPLALSFGVEDPLAIDIVIIVANVVDLILRCVTSYTSDRGTVLISDPRETTKHYVFSRWFVLDLMSCIPWENVLQNRSLGRLMSISKCGRLVHLPELTRRIVPLGLSGIFGIFELLGIVFLVSHFMACFWNLIALDWRSDTANYEQQPVFDRYALCWSTAIGALNASPPVTHNPKEEITIALYMILGNVLQATVFGSVAHVISSFNEQEDAYHKKLMLTHDRCRFLGIPESLSERIQLYYRCLYRETKSVGADADVFINELSPALVCDVKYNLYRDMLKQIPFLASKRVDNSVVELLVMHLTTVIFMKDDVVTRKGERADWMGFIGIKGSVALLEYTKQQQHRVRRVLRKGDYFGETSVFQASTRENTVVALSWVQIHQLFRKDFESVKTNYPEQGSILEEEMSKYMTSKAAHKL